MKFLKNRSIFSCDIFTIIEYHLFPFIRQSINSLLPKRASLASEKVSQRFFDFTLQHDNARPHTVKMTKEKLQALGWEVLPHPPYSPDLAPSDFHLFRN